MTIYTLPPARDAHHVQQHKYKCVYILNVMTIVHNAFRYCVYAGISSWDVSKKPFWLGDRLAGWLVDWLKSAN